MNSIEESLTGGHYLQIIFLEGNEREGDEERIGREEREVGDRERRG